ncbi:hypothetical protein Catovirus_1_98 [Catovirus CTV1]|uniref:Uncharacterized protein n=1 Tax=Catovirus CTV1 TaxID=1977631 RepID=A0A1V0S8T5_9VIRU|nr:hypothetical protein Catovirus_1_98 [Catovirus CTV1]
MKSITIKNKHHFIGKDDTVEVMYNSQNVIDDVIIRSKKFNGSMHDLNNIVYNVYYLFTFFGVGLENLSAKDIDKKEMLDIVKDIYKIKLVKKIVFVHVDTCTCNMGNCGEPLEYFLGEPCENLEKAFCELAFKYCDENDLYEYPDSVFVFVDQIDKSYIAEKIDKKDITEMDKIGDVIYVTKSYER